MIALLLRKIVHLTNEWEVQIENWLTTIRLPIHKKLAEPSDIRFRGLFTCFYNLYTSLKTAWLRHLNLSVTVLPTRKAAGSNPGGRTTKRPLCFRIAVFLLWFPLYRVCMDFGLWHIMSQTKSYWIWFRPPVLPSISSLSEPTPNSPFGAGF